jgi:hypothetical protein
MSDIPHGIETKRCKNAVVACEDDNGYPIAFKKCCWEFINRQICLPNSQIQLSYTIAYAIVARLQCTTYYATENHRCGESGNQHFMNVFLVLTIEELF